MTAPVRVALVIGQLHAGGSERQPFELARGLHGGPCEPHVYCLSDVVQPFGPRLEAAGIPLRVLPRRHRFEPRRVTTLARYFKQDRIDLVNSFSQHVNFYAYLAVFLAGRGVLVASSRTTEPPGRSPARLLHSWVFRRSRQVVANSAAVRDFTVTSYGVPPARIVEIVNGVDLDRCEFRGDPLAVRAGLGIPPGAPVAGMVGRLSAEKRVDLFLEAARRISLHLPESRFLVVGEGESMGSLTGQAASMGLDARLVFTGARDDVAALLAAMDLLVLASDFEGLPNVVLEAMAAGRPVVATDLAGCRELVVTGATGFLVPPGDPEALALKMAEVLALPDRGRALGSAGRDRARAQFSLEAMVRRYEELYLRLVREARATRS